MELYKWLNGREATHVPGFRYRLRVWTPEIKGTLVACENGYHLNRVEHLSRWIARDLFVAEYDGEILDAGDKIVVRRCRIVERLAGWDERTARLFAADCAERVLPLFESVHPNDDRPRKAIEATRLYASGEISVAARAAAGAVAWNAARDAAEAAAWNAARDAAEAAARAAAEAAARAAAEAAARDAARAAARVAAWDAARAAAADAAWGAAWDAAWEWQGEQILRYARGGI